MPDKLSEQVQRGFAKQDKINAKLVNLVNKYGSFIIYYKFGDCWLGKIGDGGYVLIDAKGKELKRWNANINCWAEACDIIEDRK